QAGFAPRSSAHWRISSWSVKARADAEVCAISTNVTSVDHRQRTMRRNPSILTQTTAPYLWTGCGAFFLFARTITCWIYRYSTGLSHLQIELWAESYLSPSRKNSQLQSCRLFLLPQSRARDTPST